MSDERPARDVTPVVLIGGGLLAAAVLLVVTGVRGGAYDRQPDPQPEPVVATTAAWTVDEQAFLVAVVQSGQVDAVGEDALVQSGHATCGALGRTDATTVWLNAARIAGPGGVAVTRAAADTLCPEQHDAVQAVADAVLP